MLDPANGQFRYIDLFMLGQNALLVTILDKNLDNYTYGTILKLSVFQLTNLGENCK
jgi:hypothetical protein